ncbi:hypothetical protein MRX96_018813 [Rhipicephalus microplus]
MASPVSTIESAAMDAADTNEYPVDPDDRFLVHCYLPTQAKEATNSAPEPLPAKNQVTPRPPPLAVDDFEGDHPATHPKYPAREQRPPNKHYVKKALEANALAPPPTSPPKGHRPMQVQNEAQSIKEQREVSGQGLGILKQHAGKRTQNHHYHPGTDPPPKNRAASAERPESPPAKKPAPAGQTPPAKTPWIPAMPPSHGILSHSTHTEF